MNMAGAKSRSSLPCDWNCPDCGHRLVRVVDKSGHEHTLDTTIPTWVITGWSDAVARAIAVRSGGYPEHACQ